MPSPAISSHQPGTPAGPSQRFVDAALDLFLEHGYNGTSLAMIGDRLGVSKAAVTYHFRSKEELLAAVVGPAFTDLAQLLDEVEAVRRESARRREALHAYIDYLIRQRQVAAWLSRDVAAMTHPVVVEPAMALSGRIDALLVADRDEPLGRIWGAAITQALTGPILSEIPVSDDELRLQLEGIGETLLRGYQTARRRAAEPTD
ncbi:AcrR family transcriptional regulator [Nocardioides marinisabuli]|uniref:AcrR family transcriptional regulator n=1 Tax=Nocardioides marinisabuli TaxID=419476 RepID=A0A7Y9EZJ3_9ACTN|nr:TetR/AcrR family transcriptional regulator [Nocardioides marinisabuli]NYD56626.1 AcrR family transcriptional regulator [Nocardioides marinisabuli]